VVPPGGPGSAPGGGAWAATGGGAAGGSTGGGHNFSERMVIVHLLQAARGIWVGIRPGRQPCHAPYARPARVDAGVHPAESHEGRRHVTAQWAAESVRPRRRRRATLVSQGFARTVLRARGPVAEPTRASPHGRPRLRAERGAELHRTPVRPATYRSVVGRDSWSIAPRSISDAPWLCWHAAATMPRRAEPPGPVRPEGFGRAPDLRPRRGEGLRCESGATITVDATADSLAVDRSCHVGPPGTIAPGY
jgi:hypothetical protein